LKLKDHADYRCESWNKSVPECRILMGLV
jgi:hypothetical protein